MKRYIILTSLTLPIYMIANTTSTDTNKSIKFKDESNDEVQNEKKLNLPSKEKTYVALYIEKVGTTRSGAIVIKNSNKKVVNGAINISGKDTIEIHIADLSKFYRKGYTFNYGDISEPISQKEGTKVFTLSTSKLKSGDTISLKDRFGNSMFEIKIRDH